MRRLLFILLLPWAAHSEPLWLGVGQVRTVPAKPGATIRIGARGILRVVESESAIKLIGLKPGATTVAIDDRAYNAIVSREGQAGFFRELQKTVTQMKGLSIRLESSTPEITGTLLRFSDWEKLASLARHTQGHYRFLAQALPDVAEKAMAHFRSLANTHGFPVLRFSADPQFNVHIPAAAPSLKSGAGEVFAPYGMDVKSDAAAISVQPLVRTQVVLAEVSRSKGQIFGVEWPSSYQAQIIPKIAPGVDSYMVTLKALASSGQAQILASPNLLCRSGGEARFLAGGEFPVPVVGLHSRGVIWKQHGVILNVRPKADFQGAISLEIETEVSLIDMAHAVNGIPALKTNKVRSHFDLPGRRTIALSGLLRQELGQSQEGLPLLSQIPILGALFSSRQFQSQQSELVIFVTPEINTPDSDTPIEMPKGWVRHEW